MAVRKRAKTASKPVRRATQRSAGAKRATRRSAGARRPVRRTTTAPASAPARTVRRTSRPTAPRAAPRIEARTGAVPSAIGCVGQHFDFTSHAMDEVRRFYTEFLGFADFTHDPNFNYLRVVTATGASLGFMPPMPGPPEQWRPPREPALYFMVEDVDHACRTLTARGVVLQQEPTDMPWMHRVAMLKDPEGRMIMLAQVLKP